MHVNCTNNMININGNELRFQSDICQVLYFEKYIILLIMDDEIPDDNIYAVNYNGEIEWNISEIISFSYSEAYISVSKINENVLAVVTYNGVELFIDILKKVVLYKKIVK